MNKLKKPHFQFSTVDKASSLFGIIISFLAYISLPWYIPTIILLILFLLLLCFNLYKYKKQIDILFNEYNTICENHSALSKQFKNKSNQVAEQKKLLYQYDYILNDIIHTVNLKIVNTSKEENEFLITFNKVLLQYKEYLYNIKKGDNENEFRN